MEHLTSLFVKSASIDEYLDLNYVDMFPQMINNLFLGGRALPSLKELYLHDAYSVIDQCSSLKKVVIPEPAMPKLQKLIIKNCNSLTMVRIAINTVTRLEEMVPQELICFQ
ncbi:disease resistance protein RPM1-like [Fagus crenata]